MSISIWKIFTIFGILSTWSQQALADGKITAVEALDLITQLAAALSLPLEFDVSELLDK